mmetsp:Transcript_10104/g.14574  ORF Transcript_10104/g.14574 Transcript_10104/m.14574 type:complete len:163 (+) Transcript_10104:5155-5643(+)
MWNGKFSDRATANLTPGEKVWICGGSYPNQKAVFVAHKEKTVEVRRAPGLPTNHIRPEHVMPLSFLEEYSKSGSAAYKNKFKTGVRNSRSSSATASMVSSVSASASPSYESIIVHAQSPAKMQLQSLIEEEKEKARISQEKILSLFNALEIVERAEAISDEA